MKPHEARRSYTHQVWGGLNGIHPEVNTRSCRLVATGNTFPTDEDETIL